MGGRVLVLKNIEREGPGTLSDCFKRHGVVTTTIELGNGQPPPDSLRGFDALVVLGGPPSANDTTPEMLAEVRLTQEALERGVPYLGICLGMQVLAKAAGGRVMGSPVKEVGFRDTANEPYRVILTPDGFEDPLLKGVPQSFRVFQLHGKTIEPSPNTVVLGTGTQVPAQFIRVGSKAYSTQFHLEVTWEMLAQWMAEDPDLADRSVDDYRMELEAMRSDYTRVAYAVFDNFLVDVAQLGQSAQPNAEAAL